MLKAHTLKRSTSTVSVFLHLIILTSDKQDDPKGRWIRTGSRSLGKLSSHFVIIIDLNTICGIKLLDIEIMPVKADAH